MSHSSLLSRIPGFMARAALCCLAGLLVGCIVTGYGPMKVTTKNPLGRGGYKDVALGDDLYRVVFVSGAYDLQSYDHCQKMAMRRAAELTLSHGFTHFAIVSESKWTWGGLGDLQFKNIDGPSHYDTETTGQKLPGVQGLNASPAVGLLVKFYRNPPADVVAYSANAIWSGQR